MIKTFVFGILLGIVAAAGAIYALPVVDQHREISYISVAPNGGNREQFHINIPIDRVMVGAAGQPSGLPEGLEWPQDDIFANVSSEIFKIRNERNVVVGVGARTVANEVDSAVIDWVLHLPARGSIFVSMATQPSEGGHRIGQLRIGTDEFAGLSGSVTEKWVADESGEEDAPDGRIELFATYVSELEPVE